MIRYILRNIKKNIIPALLIFFSIVFSVVAVYLNFNISKDIVSLTDKTLQGSLGGYDLLVSIEKDHEPIEQTFKLKDSNSMLYLNYKEEEETINDIESHKFFVKTNTQELFDKNMISISEGSLPSNDFEVIISSAKAEIYNLSIGDMLTFEGKTYKISAISGNLGYFEQNAAFILEMVVPLPKDEKVFTFFVDIDVENLNEYASELEENNAGWYATELIENPYQYYLSSIKSVLTIVIIITVLIAFFIINSVAGLVIDSRIPTTAAFRSIGATRKKINTLLLSEFSVYGILGSAVGIGVGEACRYLICSQLMHSTLQGTINPWYVIISLLFGVVLELLIVSISLFKNRKQSIRSTIFAKPSVRRVVTNKTGIIGFVIFVVGLVLYLINKTFNIYINIIAFALILISVVFIVPYVTSLLGKLIFRQAFKKERGSLLMTANNMVNNRSTRNNISLLSLVFSLTFAVIFISNSINIFYKSYEKRYPYDIIIKATDINNEDITMLKSIEGVGECTVESFRYVRYSEVNGKESSGPVYFVKEGKHSNSINVDYELEKNLKEGEVILDKMYLTRLGLRVGDSIYYDFDDNQYSSFTARIVGTCDSTVFNVRRSTVLMSDVDYDKHISTFGRLVGITLLDGYETKEVMKTLSLLPYIVTGRNLMVFSKQQYIDRELQSMKDAVSLVNVMPGFIISLSILGLANNLIVSFNRKKKDYAVLYSTCMSKKQISKMLFYELLITYLFGIVFAVIASILDVLIIRDIVYYFMMYVDLAFNPIKILIMLGAGLVAIILVFFVIHRMVNKIKVVEELKYE